MWLVGKQRVSVHICGLGLAPAAHEELPWWSPNGESPSWQSWVGQALQGGGCLAYQQGITQFQGRQAENFK